MKTVQTTAIMCVTLALCFSGCEEPWTSDEVDDQARSLSELVAQGGSTESGGAAVSATGEEGALEGGESDGGDATGSSASSGGPIDLGSVRWLNTDVSGWAQTASLSASVSGGSINLKYSKSKSWPSVSVLGASVNANPWVFVNRDGTWYAATFEWLRPGQTSKPVGTVSGSHIKKSPLNNFHPQSGEVYGFMVSGLARTKVRNVQERSNVVMVRWP